MFSGLIFYIVGVGFIIGQGVLFYSLFRYRRREGQKASYITGEKWSQLAWILVPGAIIMFLDFTIDFAGTKAYEEVKLNTPSAQVTVEVTGKQFNWDFLYSGPDDVFGTKDDLKLENELHVPVNKVVNLVLKSDDVIQ